jgi:import inner membrane translocase subunit TIM22
MKSTRTVLREMALNMRDKSVSYGKAFATFGALYSFNECVIEKFRAKHDKVNPALAGCTTGAMLAYSGEER